MTQIAEKVPAAWEHRGPVQPVPRQQQAARWRVLVVESSPSEAKPLVDLLRRHGHEVTTAGTGAAALRAYEEADLVLLDLELPDMDGLDICRCVRATCDTPVIVVTARDSELDRVLALKAGADDCLVKPYGFRELLARMDAVMRRSRPRTAPARRISYGPLTIDQDAREVVLGGQPVEVTRKEFDLLYLLASHPDTVISRKRLMRDIWNDSWSRRTVDTHVSALRNKLGASTWIVTVRGVGFRIGHG